MQPESKGVHQRLLVVVPACNEADRIDLCLTSLFQQGVAMQVFVSDNASTDDTARRAVDHKSRLNLLVRSVDRLPAVAHFVSAGRWGFDESDAPYCAFLAGDDTWQTGFVRAALEVLQREPGIDGVYPSFLWGGSSQRLLRPTSFRWESKAARQVRALVLSDHRELANLVYGVYRREAFGRLLEGWERAGEGFGSDYAAVWSLLGHHRVAAAPDAIGQRHERPDTDLLQRVGMSRATASGPVNLGRTYFRLNLTINRLLAAALDRAAPPRSWRPSSWQLQVLRGPQWVWGARRHLAARSVSKPHNLG